MRRMSTQFVVVLLHGFLGFSRVGPVHYFRGLEAALEPFGYPLLVPNLPPASSVAERAISLAEQLDQYPASEFVLLGHSMGGLDGRYVISHLDPGRKIKALLTVSTPHRGTTVAAGLLKGGGPFSVISRRFFQSALREFEPSIREREAIPDRPDVAYHSYATARIVDEISPFLRSFAKSISGENDGLVPASSAKWGDFRGVLRADHFEVVGWSLGWPSSRTKRPFNHIAFWKMAVQEVVAAAALRGRQEWEKQADPQDTGLGDASGIATGPPCC